MDERREKIVVIGRADGKSVSFCKENGTTEEVFPFEQKIPIMLLSMLFGFPALLVMAKMGYVKMPEPIQKVLEPMSAKLSDGEIASILQVIASQQLEIKYSRRV